MTDVAARTQQIQPALTDRSLRIVRLCGLIVMAIGVSGLLGWILGNLVLNSIYPGYKPIAVSAAIIFILLGGVQVLVTYPPLHRGVTLLLFALTLGATVFGLLEIIHLVTGADVTIENAILRQYPALYSDPNAHISPVAGVLVWLIGLAQSFYLWQLLVRRQLPGLANAIGILGSVVSITSVVFILSYIYRTPLLYQTIYIPIALLAALAALLSGIGLVMLSGKDALPLSWFSGPSTRALLLRAFLPLTAVLLLLSASAQYFLTRLTPINPAFSAPIITMVFLIIMSVVILQVARGIGGLIDRAEEERRRAEEQLREVNESLEERVHLRTAELETSNRELEAFSYTVAHDLRSPLRALDGYSKYLLEKAVDRLDARSADYLARIRAAAQRMGRLIDDLLNMARISRVPVQRQSVDISKLAASVVEELRRNEPDRRVEVEIQPELCVPGDPGLLQIVLENLLGNAWKFTSTREDARITLGMTSQDGRPVYFVRDNGVGFDMAYVHTLFQPFHRLHTEAEFPGTGIGLALVQRIIARHGGRVWAEAAVGKGATFYFTVGD